MSVDSKAIDAIKMTPVGGQTFVVQRVPTFKVVVLTTSARLLILRNLVCHVEKENSSMDVTVGRPIMRILGYSTDLLLVNARDAQAEWELAGAQQLDTESVQEPSPLQRMCRLEVAAQDRPAMEAADDGAVDNVERHETRTALPKMRSITIEVVVVHLVKKIEVARRLGLTLEGQARLKTILSVWADCFRLEFGNDPPVRVAPLQVRSLKPGAGGHTNKGATMAIFAQQPRHTGSPHIQARRVRLGLRQPP